MLDLLNNIRTEHKIVPNRFPDYSAPYRIAIIGEAPGAEEIHSGEPFIGSSGHLLMNLMSNAGLTRGAVFLGNICQHQPPGNKIEAFAWNGPEIQSGLTQLSNDLAKFKPHLCVLLGDAVLRAAKGQGHKVSNWRGSLFRCDEIDSVFYGYKCMATHHPANVLRQYDNMPFLRFNLTRAKDQGTSPELVLPFRNLDVHLSAAAVCDRLRGMVEGQLTAIDIEGGVDGMTCISLAQSPNDIFICAFGQYSPEEEALVMVELAKVLENPRIPKVLQNGLYDAFVLAYRYKINIRGMVEDTMLKFWEMYAELPKKLSVQTSLLTLEPYYKDDRTSEDMWTHYEYCCKDSGVTHEICSVLDKSLASRGQPAVTHYRFNMSMLAPLLYMELRGMRYDLDEAKAQHAQELIILDELQTRVNSRCGSSLNMNSPKQMCRMLYDVMKFPVQHPKEGNSYVKTKRTADKSALLNIGKTHKDQFLYDILAWRAHDYIRETLETRVDADGRIRCAYNVVGSETGRLTCYESPTGSGYNLQTVTKSLRRLFLADEGYYLFQCDLSGADGWTVAAHCAARGDTTMLEDYLFGIKPAQVIVLLLRHGYEVNTWTRERIKEAAAPISEEGPDGWTYFACKRVQHGTNYGLGPKTMTQQILADSYKIYGTPYYATITECEKLKALYLSRYRGVTTWQSWVAEQLRTKGELSCASGHRRKFFGRLSDNATIQAGYAHEPQANTTYATNRALLNLWSDPTNRRNDGSLVIEPLHHMHDALIGQFPTSLVDESVSKIQGYFNNPITIAGITLTIPYAGAYGPNWGKDGQIHKIK